MNWSHEERAMLQRLDNLFQQPSARTIIEPIVSQVEQKLIHEAEALLAWQTIPLATYGSELPAIIRSSWVFILRSGATTGAERHPNSHQRVMSYRRLGDLQIWADERWQSNILVSDPKAPLEERWASIPPLTWHQAAVPGDDWVVVSFHTAAENELIEERPDPSDPQFTRQRRYHDFLA